MTSWNMNDKNGNAENKETDAVRYLVSREEKGLWTALLISSVFGTAFIIWAAFVFKVTIDDKLKMAQEPKEIVALMRMDSKEFEKKVEEKKKKKAEEKKKEKSVTEDVKQPTKTSGANTASVSKGDPNGYYNRGVLKVLSARTNKAGFNAYSLMNNKSFASDIDKVLKNVSGLSNTGEKTEIAGPRKGKANVGFNGGYGAGNGKGAGLGDMINSLLGSGSGGGIGPGGKGSINTKSKGGGAEVSEKDLDVGTEGGRSRASIMRVVNAKTPGLRYIFNKYQKSNPGFSGVVTLKFVIAPSGDIISLTIVKSTTGISDFDQEIADKIKTWKFEEIKAGNVTTIIPVTFSE